MLRFRDVDLDAIRVLLCDADGNLFPSEEPAFVASAGVTNRFLRAFGVDREFAPEELRLATTGKNFRTTAVDLAVACGIPLAPEVAAGRGDLSGAPATHAPAGRRPALTAAELDRWVAEEKGRVTAYLAGVLAPDPGVIGPLSALGERFVLSVVSSSAASRLAACFAATALDSLFPAGRRFSAEDSLPVPTSKPDPAIYLFAGERLGIAAHEGLAVEDSLPGVRAAVAAGFPTVGNVQFVSPGERPARIAAFERVGVAAVVGSWGELAELCAAGGSPHARV